MSLILILDIVTCCTQKKAQLRQYRDFLSIINFKPVTTNPNMPFTYRKNTRTMPRLKTSFEFGQLEKRELLAALGNGQEIIDSIEISTVASYDIEVTSQGVLLVSVGDLAEGASSSPALELFDPNDNLIGFANDPDDAQIKLFVGEVGTYRAEVSEGGNDQSLDFRIRATTLPGSPELIDGRDSVLSNDVAFTGSLPLGSFAVFPLSVGSTGTLRVTVEEVTPNTVYSPSLELFRPDGTSLGHDARPSLVELEFEIDQVGMYTAVVSESGNNAAYEFRVQASGLSPIPETLVYFDEITGQLFLTGDDLGNEINVRRRIDLQMQVDIAGQEPLVFPNGQLKQVVFNGNGGDDAFSNVSNIPSYVRGGSGNDHLSGGSGDDTIIGQHGNDTISGRQGNDRLIGSAGDDQIHGGEGNDRIYGSEGRNQLHGNEGDDLIYGGIHNDTIYGNDGADHIFGLAGDDRIYSGDGGIAGGSYLEADLVLGMDGDDLIIGGDGLNIFWGGNGNDRLGGGRDAENRLHGQAGDDGLTGGEQNDYIATHDGDDRVWARDGDDFIVAGPGSANIIGGKGTDTLRFSGFSDQYRVSGSELAYMVRDLRQVRNIPGAQGNHRNEEIENYQFADGNKVPAVSAIERVAVQPIIVADDDGTNRANFLGRGTLFEWVNDITAQANIQVVFLNDVQYDNSFANRGNGGPRSVDELTQIVAEGDQAGVGHPNPGVIDAYFVSLAPGQENAEEDEVQGYGLFDTAGIAIQIGADTLDDIFGHREIARVIAREIGRNLGLVDQFNAEANLQFRDGTGFNLNPMQRDIMLESVISRPF